MPLPAGILKNESTNRFHPILFRPGPAPSSEQDEDLQRYKSQVHHTAGFDTIEQAQEFLMGLSTHVDTGVVWEWDGSDIPAIVTWFSTKELDKAEEKRLATTKS